MSEHQSILKAGQIQFHQWCEPPLEPGKYTVSVNQKVSELEGESTSKGIYENKFEFSVAGPRFGLNPSEIYSVYPPKGHIGDFANSLPHVVFTRRTLPWERSIIPGPRAETDRLPWMALLVFSAQDFNGTFPEVTLRPVGELINPKESADFVGPQIGELADYESNNDLCNMIDLPWDLFQSVAPSAADLGYLSHVREVNTGNKETLSFLADGWFSVVLANRFPQPEIAGTEPPLAVENRAFLVSLEGMKDYLPGSESSANKKVRLAVLSNWSFQCRAAFTFKSSMEKIDVQRLNVPWKKKSNGNGLSKVEEQVRSAFERGFTALNHSTRLGEKTVSWYRGPLVPLYLTKEPNYKFVPAADAALRYNPIDGMMDITYAAAFQLGRLLALQDRHFATALYAYRSNVRRQVNRVLGMRRIQSLLGSTGVGEENDLMSAYLETLDADHNESAPTDGWAAKGFVVGEKNDADQDARKNPNELNLITDFDLTIPRVISQWLAKLMLLYRVPFVNLVPDERMLPPDSMRFFYLDPGWLKCLLEGACSVGRSSSHDELVDKNLRDNFLKLAIEESPNIRARTPQQNVGLAESSKVSEIPSTGLDWPQLTGFLMRSPVVAGWQGLEMQAWSDSDSTNALTPLRIDRLAPDIMLCIFNGKVNRIEVKQPPEGMHFGASVKGGEFMRFHLRTLKGSDPGGQLETASNILIPLREQPLKRVVKVADLATELKTKLEENNAREKEKEFTSADFGVEMVESPGRVIFDAKPPKRNAS